MFEDEEIPNVDLGTLFWRTLFEWSKVWGFTQHMSLTDFIHSLHYST